MTTYVQLGEEDLGLELARLIDIIHGNTAASTSAATGGTTNESKEESSSSSSNTLLETPSMKYVINTQYSELIRNGILRNTSKIHSLDSSTYDTLFSLVFSIVDRIDNTNEQYRIVRDLMNVVTDGSSLNTHSSVKLGLLVNLFNQFYGDEQAEQDVPSTIHRCIQRDITLEILYRTLQYAVDTKQSSAIQAQLKFLNTWLGTQYILDQQQDPSASTPAVALPASLTTPSSLGYQSHIYLLAYQATQDTYDSIGSIHSIQRNALQNEADAYLYRYLRSMSTAMNTPGMTQSALPYAAAAALRSISLPLSTSQPIGGAKAKAASYIPYTSSSAASSKFKQYTSPLDASKLLSLPIIQSLQHSKTERDRLLYELLSIVSSSNVKVFHDFVNQNQSFFSSTGLSTDSILHKLRTLSLCRLALEHERLSIDTVKERLELQNVIDVEDAVITAIMSGKLDAKIDEESNSIIIKRVTGINMWSGDIGDDRGGSVITGGSDSNWSTLSKKLSTWRTNVNAVLNTMHQNHPQQDIDLIEE